MNYWMKSSAMVLAFATFSASAVMAQDNDVISKNKKITKDETIVIKRKGDSKEKFTIIVDGDNITINGKPIDEFKDDGLEVLRNNDEFDFAPEAFAMTLPRKPIAPRGGIKMISGDNFWGSGNKAFLGVTSEKADGGAKIKEVTKESPAAKAGLKQGDIITKAGDSKIEDASDLYEAIGKHKSGDKVDITYKRDGKESTVAATLEKAKHMAFAYNFNMDNNFKGPQAWGNGFQWNHKPRLGMQIQDTEDGKGVKVIDVDDDAPAGKAGLKEDDIITSVNGKAVTDVDDLRESVKDLKDGDVVKLNYNRNNQSASVDVKIPKKLKTSDL